MQKRGLMRMKKSLVLYFSIIALCVSAGNTQNSVLSVVLNNSLSYHQRAKQLVSITSNLQQSDVDAIHVFLELKDGGRLKNLEFNSLKNDLVLCLMRQSRKDDKLVPHLIAMYKDTSHDLVWRNYCVQFMGRIYPDSTMQEKELLKKTLQAVLKDPISMLAITGMIAMELNKGSLKTDKEFLNSRAFELLQKDIPPYAMVTLIQICGMNRIKPDQVRPLLYSILKNSKETQLKVSAIAALGEYGNRKDLDIIESYRKNSDVRLRSAAMAACKKLTQQSE